jgi:putative transposase
MMTTARRHHSQKDVEAKLRQADEMVANGRTQKEISRALGISVMTYHRWRRSRPEQPLEVHPEAHAEVRSAAPVVAAASMTFVPRPDQLSTLEVENERLRRLVTDLLLEKMALQEQLEGRRSATRRRHS